ncbi:MAG: hydroxyisourate hydrolase [Pseudomonadota bacterium]
MNESIHNAVSLSSHVLDLDAGRPASGLRVTLKDPAGTVLSEAVTNDDGRVTTWPGLDSLRAGVYEVCFETGSWYAAQGQTCFYPRVHVLADLAGDQPHYHVPLLLNRFGYSTYRGS